jgi:trehalose-phosphatase
MVPLILTNHHLSVLASFAASNVLVALDYDGTLAPIAPTPEEAHMRPRTSELLARVAQRYPCVVISGRSLDDLMQRLERIPVWHLVGDHGFQDQGGHREPAPHVRDWVDRLRHRLPRTPGLVIEEKPNTVTVHYRQVTNKQEMVSAIAAAVLDLPDARAVNGAEAVNLLPRGGPDKGTALRQARRAFACDTAIYIGDDGTDEDAFRSDGPDRLLSIRIGSEGESAARYRLEAQLDIDRFLSTLLTLRATRDEGIYELME